MRYGLAPHLHAATFEDRAIILDERRDHYCLLGPPAGTVIAALDGQSSIGDLPGLRALVDLGIVVESDWPRAYEAWVPITSSPFGDDSATLERISLVPVLVSLVNAMVRLRLSGISGGLAAARAIRARRRTLRSNMRSVASLAIAWDRARRRIPVRRRCLRDALAFYRGARAKGHDVAFVIGVRLDPFAAHSWVQAGPLLLTDDVDTVAGFRPILVI